MTESIKSTLKLANGVELPRVGLGVFRVEQEEDLRRSVKAALDAGYIHIDTAAVYNNEDMVGRAVKDFGKREDLFITTKVWNDMQGDVEKAFEESLEKLQTDYVDLYLIHWPSPSKGLYVDAWKALIKLYEAGRAKAIGVSNFKVNHLEKIIAETGFKPHVNQIERHPYCQQKETEAFCKANGIALEAYAPLTSGRISEITPDIEPIAKKYGKSVAQIMLRWQLQTDWIVLPKSITASRVLENSQLFDFKLDDDDMKAIEALDKNEQYFPDSDKATF